MRVLLLVALVAVGCRGKSESAEPAAATKLRLRKGPGAPASGPPSNGGKRLNPVDSDGLPIMAHGDKCVVQPDAEKETTKQVDCPGALDDAAWDHCDGVLSKAEDGTCTCLAFTCMSPNHCKVPSQKAPCPK